MVDAVKDVKEAAFFLKKEKPYWWDLSGQAREIKELLIELKVAIKKQGGTWVSTTVKGVKDEIALFTEGGITMVSFLSFFVFFVNFSLSFFFFRPEMTLCG